MAEEKLVLRPKKAAGPYSAFSVRIPKPTAEQIEEVASVTGRSRNEIVRIFLDYALDNCEIEKTDTGR